MKSVLLLYIVLAIVNAVCGHCDGCFEGQCYTKSYLTESEDAYYKNIPRFTNELYIDRQRNNVYFNIEQRNLNIIENEIRKISLDTNITSSYSNLRLKDLAVDEDSNDIYVTAYSAGFLLKLNIPQNFLYSIGLTERHYNKIEFKYKLYYTIDDEKGIFFYEKNESKIVPGTENHIVKDFVVDKKGDIYYVTTYFLEATVWRLKSCSNNATVLGTGPILLTLDKDGNAHFINTSTHAILRVNYETEQLYEVGAFKDAVDAAVFDKENNIIYSNADNIYHMKQNDQAGHCSTIFKKTVGRTITLQTSDNQSIGAESVSSTSITFSRIIDLNKKFT